MEALEQVVKDWVESFRPEDAVGKFGREVEQAMSTAHRTAVAEAGLTPVSDVQLRRSRAEATRILTSQYIADLYEITQRYDGAEPGGRPARTAIAVPKATVPGTNFYAKSGRLAKLLADAAAELVVEAIRTAKASDCKMVSEPRIAVELKGFMLEVFLYCHVL